MTHTIEVLSAEVTINKPAYDRVELTIDADPGLPSDGDECHARFEVERGKGVEWVKNNFPGLRFEVVDFENGKVTVIDPFE